MQTILWEKTTFMLKKYGWLLERFATHERSIFGSSSPTLPYMMKSYSEQLSKGNSLLENSRCATQKTMKEPILSLTKEKYQFEKISNDNKKSTVFIAAKGNGV